MVKWIYNVRREMEKTRRSRAQQKLTAEPLPLHWQGDEGGRVAGLYANLEPVVIWQKVTTKKSRIIALHILEGSLVLSTPCFAWRNPVGPWRVEERSKHTAGMRWRGGGKRGKD